MKAWENFLKLQEKALGVDTVNKWLRPLKVVDFDACNLYLEAKDAFQVIWFEEHIRKRIASEFFNNNNKKIKVHIGTKKRNEPEKKITGKNKLESKNPKSVITFEELDPLATFDYFVPSETSVLAHKLLCKIANYDPISKSFIPQDGELSAFNPIYLFGTEGVGKTHLLMATAHALIKRKLKVVFVKAETFTEHVVSAIRSSEMHAFRQAYRNIDVLLIDDVHLFSRKWATQEELFHTFNTLHLAGKQIILSAKGLPADLQNLEPRLISRFEWGIVLPLHPLEGEDIKKALNMKAEAMNTPLHSTVEDFMISTFKNSPKSLIYAFETLILRNALRNKEENFTSAPITVTQCKNILNDLIQREQEHCLTPEKIVNQVASYFGLKKDDIIGRSQTRDSTLARQLSMYFCRCKLKLAYKNIGDFFGRRDHSTVMSSIKLIEKNLSGNDKLLSSAYYGVLKKLNA